MQQKYFIYVFIFLLQIQFYYTIDDKFLLKLQQTLSIDFKDYLGHQICDIQIIRRKFLQGSSDGFDDVEIEGKKILQQIGTRNIRIFSIEKYISENIINFDIQTKCNITATQNITTYYFDVRRIDCTSDPDSSLVSQIRNCDSNEYFDIIYRQCKKCQTMCKGCLNQYYCSDCTKKSFFEGRYDMLNDLTCGNCQDGQKLSSFMDIECQGCPSSCKCDENNRCIQCKILNNKIKIFEEMGNCDECPLLYFFIEGIMCKRCHYSCKTCNGQLQTNCLTCREGFFMNNDSSCRYGSQCSEGYFKKDTSCVKCSQNCKKCTSFDQCKECFDNQPVNKDSTCLMCDTKNGYFIKDFNCIKCSENCKQCTSIEKCTECQDNRPVNKDNTCLRCDTDNGYFIDKYSKKCLQCYPGCQTCGGIKPDQCLSCKPRFYRAKQNL